MAARATSAGGRRIRASVTLVSLCLTTAMGMALGSYLSLCTRSALSSTRLLHQDRAQELAQVGLEEALWALNQDAWTSSGPNNTAVWTTSGASRSVVLTYDLPSQGGSGEVALTVANYASAGPTWPEITSTATVTMGNGQTFSKALRATTAPVPLFGNAIASAESYVSFVAAGTVDSWNSDPDNDPATPPVPYAFTAGNPANYAAVVAGRGNGTYGVSLTQATIRGYVATFGLPVSYSTSGSPVGSVVGPSTPAAVKVDTARLGKSAFVPASPVLAVTLPSTTGTNYGGLVGNVLALVSALLGAPPEVDVYKVNGDLNILGLPLISPSLTVSRPLKLIVDGNLNIGGAGKITITATGSLEIFVAGDVTIGGAGIVNQTDDTRKMAIFSTSTSGSDTLEFTTSQGYCGVIYCENKPIDIRQNAAFRGALLSRQYVRFSASATAPEFHYDTALRDVRFSHVTTPYIVKNVAEL